MRWGVHTFEDYDAAGGLPEAIVHATMRRFAREVIPLVGRSLAAPNARRAPWTSSSATS